MNSALRKKIKQIKLLILDVDGILTNGEIVLDSQGNEVKMFNVYDGFGIVLLRRAGIKVAIISARSAEAVTARAEDLGIDRIYQDAKPKSKAYDQLLQEFSLQEGETCFMADDLPDLNVFKRAGLSITVPHASEEIRKCADYITVNEGGRGAVREVCEMILKTQEHWASIVKSYE